MPTLVDLADTSAWTIAFRDSDRQREFVNRILNLQIATCSPVMLEILHSERNIREFRDRRRKLEVLDRAEVNQSVFDRAVDVYEQLASKGGAHQRQVTHTDLIIAASAELSGMRILHYDNDFEVIAEITGQPTKWLVPRGSV
jgi:predicted nucleic acid-binding protein